MSTLRSSLYRLWGQDL